MRRTLLSAFVLALLTITDATATVSTTHGSSVQVNSKWRVTISGSNESVTVTGNANDVIEWIRVTCTTSGQHVTLTATGSIGDIEEISQAGGSGELWLDSATAANIRDITANYAGTIYATTGDIYGSIYITATTQLGGGDHCGLIEAAVGDITGSILVQGGRLGAVKALNGALGLSNDPVSIEGFEIGDVWAESMAGGILAHDDATGINSIILDDGNFTDGGLTDTGGIFCERIIGDGVDFGLRVDGDLDVMFRHYAPMVTDFRIGGSFTSNASIELPAEGLTGQIIFNAADDSGTWDGDLLVDEVSLASQPYYDETPGELGGGAAGLAEFHLHGTGCIPEDGATIPGKGLTLTCFIEPPCCLNFKKATVRMYGPVSLHTTLPSATVEYWNGSSWSSTGWTIVTERPGSGDHREVVVRKSDNSVWALGQYRIKPYTGRMLCEDVDGTPNVDDFSYTFTLSDDCAEDSFVGGGFDLNIDGQMTAADLTAWGVTPCDLNYDNDVDGSDLARLYAVVALFN